MTSSPRTNVEGREFRIAHRGVLSAILVGTLLLMTVGTLAIRGPRPWILTPLLGLEALILLPVVANAMTSVVTLKGGVLTRRSVFGTKRIELARVRKADLRLVNGKAGPREQMTLVAGKTMRVGEQREHWPTLRDAILAELPPDVRPSRQA